jgi:hypothetical protein
LHVRKKMKPEYTVEMQPLTSEDKKLLLKNFVKEKVIFWRIVLFYVFVVIGRTALEGGIGDGINFYGFLAIFIFMNLIHLPLFIVLYFLLMWRPTFDIAFNRKRVADTYVVNTGFVGMIDGIRHQYVNVKIKKKSITSVAIPETMCPELLEPYQRVHVETGRYSDVLLNCHPKS